MYSNFISKFRKYLWQMKEFSRHTLVEFFHLYIGGQYMEGREIGMSREKRPAFGKRTGKHSPFRVGFEPRQWEAFSSVNSCCRPIGHLGGSELYIKAFYEMSLEVFIHNLCLFTCVFSIKCCNFLYRNRAGPFWCHKLINAHISLLLEVRLKLSHLYLNELIYYTSAVKRETSDIWTIKQTY